MPDVSHPEQIVGGLNRGQVAAVTAPVDRHHLVLAGAGCGKTTVLTRRIAFLIHSGIPAECILALTFTRKAAEEMAGRVAASCSGSGAVPLVTTFHAFALRVLGDSIDGTVNFTRIGYSGKGRVCEADERLELLAKVSTVQERRQLRLQLHHLDALLERMEVFPEKIEGVSPADHALLHTISDRFRQYKLQAGVWDFSDLLNGAVKLFSEFRHIVDHYRAQFSTILVDEFQDTNPVQITLLNLLLGSKKRLFAVGDDDQAIYAFRGADIRPTLSFATCFPGASILKLETNYRSTAVILKNANRIFHDKDPLYRKVLIAGSRTVRSSGKPSKVRCSDQAAAAAWIAAKSAQLQKCTGIAIGEMAVLFRTNQSLDTMNALYSSGAAPGGAGPQFLTVHKSKGLEFPVVFVCDLEESLFPSYRLKRAKRIINFSGLIRSFFAKRSSDSTPEDVEEERRLFYVAVTRAKEHLFLLHVRRRDVYGRKQQFSPSRFLKYIR